MDRVLESCLQLLSLFFMTIGRTTEAPAAYALTSTIKRLLDHLTESRLFSGKDLDSMSHTISDLDRVLKNTNSLHSPYLVELLANRQELCKASLGHLRKELAELEEPLPSIHEKLISILRSMSLANTKAKVICPCYCCELRADPFQFSTSEVLKLQAQLREIHDSRVDGNFVNSEGKVPNGNAKVSELLQRCLKWTDIVLDRYAPIIPFIMSLTDTNI